MTKRTVNTGIGMITYTDPSGARRIGLAGETVDVHVDDLARFNRVNGIIEVQTPAKKAAPQKRAAPKKAARGRPRKT